MQVKSLLPINIQHQLQGNVDPTEAYIDELLNEPSNTQPYCKAAYINKRTILAGQEIDKVNVEPNFVNTLQLLRINNSLNKQTHLYQSILVQIDLYFITGRVKNG